MKIRKYRVTTYSGETLEYEVVLENNRVIVKQIGSERTFETHVEKMNDNNIVVQLGYDKYRIIVTDNRVFIDKEEPLINQIIEIPTASKPVAARREEKPTVPKVVKGEIRAPLSGKIESIKVKPGDRVKQGDVVLTMISMKMSVEVKSNVVGIVEEIIVKPGDIVKTGDLLVKIKIE